MDVISKILEEMDTPEGQKKISKWVEEYVEKEKIIDNKIKEMLSNTDYLKWLDNFTIAHQNFSDDEWLYFPIEISMNDKEQVEKLHLMYRGIDKYASKNYIYPIPCDFGNFYKIKSDNIGYEIGILNGQGTLFFCNRVEIENEKEFIDFNDIMNNKKSDNVSMIEDNLNKLSNMIISLHQSGVSLYAIETTFKSTLDEIKQKNDAEKMKVLDNIAIRYGGYYGKRN